MDLRRQPVTYVNYNYYSLIIYIIYIYIYPSWGNCFYFLFFHAYILTTNIRTDMQQNEIIDDEDQCIFYFIFFELG